MEEELLILWELPGSLSRGATAPHILVEFLIRKNGAVWDGVLSAFRIQRPLQFPIAECGSVLIWKVVLCKSTIGYAQNEFAVPYLGVNNTVGVIPATLLKLKSKILNLNGQFFILEGR